MEVKPFEPMMDQFEYYDVTKFRQLREESHLNGPFEFVVRFKLLIDKEHLLVTKRMSCPSDSRQAQCDTSTQSTFTR